MSCPTLKLVVLLVFSPFLCYAQEEAHLGTAVYLELAGKGFLSGNVDFALGPSSRLTVSLTMLDHEFAKTEMEEEYPALTLPTPGIMYLYLFGRERHFLEVGGGCSISPVFWKAYSEQDSFLSLHGCVGYRFQVSRRMLFRAGFTPFYRVRWAFLPLVGVSVGYSW